MSEETTPQVVIEDDPIEVRKNKRQALIDAGEQPYGRAYEVTDHVEDLDARYADIEDGVTTEDRVVIAGRLMSKRNQGKIIFGELRDATGDIQLFCRINALGEEAFDRMKDLDVGDWIGVEGVIMRTRRGQLSVGVDKFELLSKSLRPLPEKFHGLADKEIRYRQRYVDLIINPEVKDTFAKRSKIVSAIRRYMEEQGFMEVETPFLHSIMGGANAKPFTTHFNALDRDFYLRIATELPLKRLLVGGFEKVFEIGRQFRNEGMDPYHNPEFTTMEAYQAFTDIDGMMDLTQGYIQAAAMAACGTLQVTYQGQEIDLSGEWPRRTMAGLASEYSGEEVSFDRTREDLVAILEKNGGHAEAAWGKGKLIAEIFEAVAEEKLIQPTFVIDHPLEVSPLAKKKPSDPNFTDRFELFIVGHEYANAFTELNDPIDQAERFQAQVEAKGMGDDEAMGFDHDYIRALEYGMPPAGGVGIGIDRLVMLLTDSPTIRDVLLFPAMREEKNAAAPAPKKAAPAPAPAPAPVAAPAEEAAPEAAEAPAAEFAPVAEGPLTATITREDALELLKKYNQEPFHIQHGLTVEGCMRWFANELGHGENVDFWGLVGLLHDVDFEMWPTEHCQKAPELLREAGVSEDMIRAICSHGFGHCSDIEPLHEMEKVLFAVDELTGLIWSYALMRPTKSVEGMELKSLKKKFKDKKFAAGCSRDVIREGAERLGWELDELFTKAIAAMQSCEASVASAMEA